MLWAAGSCWEWWETTKTQRLGAIKPHKRAERCQNIDIRYCILWIWANLKIQKIEKIIWRGSAYPETRCVWVLSMDSAETFCSCASSREPLPCCFKGFTHRLWNVTPARCRGYRHGWHWFDCAAHQKGPVLSSCEVHRLLFKFQTVFLWKKEKKKRLVGGW